MREMGFKNTYDAGVNFGSGYAGLGIIMRIEHLALQVSSPAAMADWYVEHLNFKVKLASDSPVPVRFIVDQDGLTMLEIYNNPKIEVPDYSKADVLTIHLAFVCNDISGETQRLIKAGATVEIEPKMLPTGDEMAILRDPWSLPVQLIKRKKRLL